MTTSIVLRAALAVISFVMGSLQAWDSGVPAAGLWIVFIVSLAIAIPPVALLIPLKPSILLGAFALSLGLLVIARLASPTPLPELFLVLLPAGMALIFTGIRRPDGEDTGKPMTRPSDSS